MKKQKKIKIINKVPSRKTKDSVSSAESEDAAEKAKQTYQLWNSLDPFRFKVLPFRHRP